MSDRLGTLAGLIEDLENLHTKTSTVYGGHVCGYCRKNSLVDAPWPCPTMEITQRHKNTDHYRISGPWADGLYRVDDTTNPDRGFVKEGTQFECKSWVIRHRPSMVDMTYVRSIGLENDGIHGCDGCCHKGDNND